MKTTANINFIPGRLFFRSTVIAAPVLFLLCFSPQLNAIQHVPGERENGGDQPPVQVAAADTLEPNDSPATAIPLYWGRESGSDARSGPATIYDGLDLDFFSIELAFGDSMSAVVAVEEAGAQPLSPSVSILDSTGTVIASDLLSPGTASVSAPVSGRYLVLISDRSLLEGDPFNGDPRGYELLLSRWLRRGDVDGSGELDYRDAFVVYMLVVGLLDSRSVGPQVLAAADVDGDGSVAGDMDDFRLLIDRVAFIPVRDPLAAGKQKDNAGPTRLALADGSLVELQSSGGLNVLSAGALADSALALWAGIVRHVELPSAARPVLEQNSPNPFNPSTTIIFSLPDRSRVELAVYSPGGRLVCSLAAGEYPAGMHSVHWDGTDSRGRPAASGVYFYRLRTGDIVLTRKLVILK